MGERADRPPVRSRQRRPDRPRDRPNRPEPAEGRSTGRRATPGTSKARRVPEDADDRTEKPYSRFPETMDQSIIDAIREEEALQRELALVRRSLNQKREGRSQVVKVEAEVAARLGEIETQLAELMAERKDVQAELAALPAPSRRPDPSRPPVEQLQILRLGRAPLVEEVRVTTRMVKEVQQKIGEMKAAAEKLEQKLGETSIAEIEKKERLLDRQLVEAAKDYKNAPVDRSQLEQAKEQLQRTKAKVEHYWQMVDELFDATTKEKALSKTLQEKEAQLKELDAKLSQLQAEAKQAKQSSEVPKDRIVEDRKRKQELTARLKPLNDKIEALLKEKRKTRPATGAKKEDTELKDEIARRDEIVSKLEELKKSIPEQLVEYDRAIHRELIGLQGRTIKCMQEEFGVYLNVQRAQGRVWVRGDAAAVAGCAEAIQQLMANAKENSVRTTLTIDPKLIRDLLGRGGKQAEQMRLKSGARINIADDGEIEINGSQEAVDLAKQMVLQIMDNVHTCTMPFDPDLTDAVYGRQGRHIRRIQEETGVRVSVSKSEHIITFKGPTERCKTAQDLYRELIADFKGPGLELKVPAEVLPRLLARGGRAIDRIEDETGVLITRPGLGSDDGERERPRGDKGRARAAMAAFHIRGPAAGVTAARAALQRLLEERPNDSVEVPVSAAAVPPLLRRPAGEPAGLCALERLRRETGCEVATMDRARRVVRVSGKLPAVEDCVRQLKELLAEVDAGPPAEGRGRDSTRPSPISVPFPSHLLSQLIHPPAGDRDAPCVLEQLRRDTGCVRVSADRRQYRVDVSGSWEAAEECVARLNQWIAENDTEGASEKTKPKPRPTSQEPVVVTVPIALLPALLRPPAGQRDALCLLEQFRRDARCGRAHADRRTGRVDIAGPHEAAEQCAEQLRRWVAERPEDATSPTTPSEARPAEEQRAVSFPVVLYALLTASDPETQQSVVERLRKTHGCTAVNVNRQATTVTFYGEAGPCDAASQELQQLLAAKEKLVHTLQLPGVSVIGAIIGPQGATIQRIAKESGCELQVDRPKKCVYLFGDPAGVEKAKGLLEAILDKQARRKGGRDSAE